MTVEHMNDPARSRIKGWLYRTDSLAEQIKVLAAYQIFIRVYPDVLEHAQFFKDKDDSWVVGPFINQATATIFEAKVKKLVAQAASASQKSKEHDPVVRHKDWHTQNIRRPKKK